MFRLIIFGCLIHMLVLMSGVISMDSTATYEQKVILRYRSDLKGKNSNLVSKVREKNVQNVDYPSPRYAHPLRVAWLNGHSSYIHFDLQDDFDCSAFEQNMSRGFTISAFICPEHVDDFQPAFWIQNGFLLSIQDGALKGEVDMQDSGGTKERLSISTEADLLQANEWIEIIFCDRIDSAGSSGAVHQLELWIDNQKVAEKRVPLDGHGYSVRRKVEGRDALAGIGVHQVEAGNRRVPSQFFSGMVMALEMKNYPADPSYLRLGLPDDLTFGFGRPAYLDREFELFYEIAEKRIVDSFMPNISPLCYVPFQNNSYIPAGLAVFNDSLATSETQQIYVGLNWKDEWGQTVGERASPPIIAHLKAENGNYRVTRYFRLDGELKKRINRSVGNLRVWTEAISVCIIRSETHGARRCISNDWEI